MYRVIRQSLAIQVFLASWSVLDLAPQLRPARPVR